MSIIVLNQTTDAALFYTKDILMYSHTHTHTHTKTCVWILYLGEQNSQAALSGRNLLGLLGLSALLDKSRTH